MREEIRAEIHSAAQDAFGAVWDNSLIPKGVHSGGLYGEMMSVEDRAHTASHEAVRAKCAELNVDPRDYYRTDPLAAVICEPACLQNWPEISVAVTHVDPDDDYLVRLDVEQLRTNNVLESTTDDYLATESSNQDSSSQSGLGY